MLLRHGAFSYLVKPATTEDRAFRLLGLRWAGAKGDIIASAGRDLLNCQRSDGAAALDAVGAA